MMTPEQRLRLVDDLIHSDTGFLADCLALDIAQGRYVTVKEKEFAELIMDLYTLVHPAFSGCEHPDWEAANEKMLEEFNRNNTK